MADIAPDPADGELIAKEWADDYPKCPEGGNPEDYALFCARFDPEDFGDPRYTEGEHPDGETVAVRVFKKPPAGYLLRNTHLTDDQRYRALLEVNACRRALGIIYDLDDKPLNAFIEAWMGGARTSPGKSPPSSPRSKTTKTPSAETS